MAVGGYTMPGHIAHQFMHEIMGRAEGHHRLRPSVRPLRMVHDILAKFPAADEVHGKVVPVARTRSGVEGKGNENKNAPRDGPKPKRVKRLHND